MSEEDAPVVPGRFDESMSVKGATTKATRERQRRIRLNDRYDIHQNSQGCNATFSEINSKCFVFKYAVCRG